MKKVKLQFGCEIEPPITYADDKKRKFIFMSWMGGELAGYARIATVQVDSDDHQGRWVKGFGLVLEGDSFVHKDHIKAKA